MNKKKDLPNKTGLDIKEICSLLIDGKRYREIADHYGVPLSTLHDFTSTGEHSARVREALNISADTYNDMAIQVLVFAQANLIEMSRARELAQHYRWLAGKRSPKRYGDKLDITTDGKQLPPSFTYVVKKQGEDEA